MKSQLMICSSCGSQCGGEIQERKIQFNAAACYVVKACEKEAKRLQDAEDLKRAGVRQDRVAGLHRLSGIPAKFAEVKFSDYELTFENGIAAKAANEFATYFPLKSVLLIGNRGTGKTMLGCAALNHIINNKGVECRYIYTPDLFEMLRASFSEKNLLEMRVFELCRTPCVFLDDPGVALDTGWTQSMYMQIIDARYRDNRPTFMASNEGMTKLEQILGARSMSRIVESYEIVEVNGDDWRMAK